MTNSHDYEFLSIQDNSPQTIDTTNYNQPLIDNDIVYKDVHNNHYFMMEITSLANESKDLSLVHSHLIDWG